MLKVRYNTRDYTIKSDSAKLNYKNNLARFMQTPANLWRVAEECDMDYDKFIQRLKDEYVRASIHLYTHSGCKFHFECIGLEVKRVDKDKLDFSSKIEYFDSNELYLGTYEVLV